MSKPSLATDGSVKATCPHHFLPEVMELPYWEDCEWCGARRKIEPDPELTMRARQSAIQDLIAAAREVVNRDFNSDTHARLDKCLEAARNLFSK